MLQYVEIAGVDVTSYLLSYKAIDEWRMAIPILEIEFSPSVTEAVTISLGAEILIKRGFVSVEEDYVFRGQIIQRLPYVSKVGLSCKGSMVEAIKAGRTKSWDKDIDIEAGVGSEIFKSLCDDSGLSYTSSTIVSTGTTDPDKIVKFIQNDEDDFQKMNELSEIYNDRIIWYDNELEYVHFEPAGYTTYAHTLVVGIDIPGQIKWKENMEQMINKVKIFGATVYDTINPPVFTSSATEFQLLKTPEDTEVRQTNSTGTLYTRGQKGLGTIGTDFDYYVDVEQKKIVFGSAKSNIWVRYGAQVPMPIIVKNQTSISTYGGPNSTPSFKKFTFNDIKDVSDAEMRGRAIIAKYSTPFVEAQNIPIADSVLETYGYIKVGNLITITDSFTGENTTAFVKIIQKTHPEPLDKITIGDEIWRTEDWQTAQMEKINLIFNELNKNQDLLISTIDLERNILLNRRYMKAYRRDVSADYIWGNINWTWGTPPAIWQGTYTNPEVVQRIIQGNMIYNEKFYDTEFKLSSTAAWTTISTLVFTSSQNAISDIIHKDEVNINSAKFSITISSGSLTDLTPYMRVDGINWEAATFASLLTFANTGQELEWKIESAGNVTVTNIQIAITEA